MNIKPPRKTRKSRLKEPAIPVPPVEQPDYDPIEEMAGEPLTDTERRQLGLIAVGLAIGFGIVVVLIINFTHH